MSRYEECFDPETRLGSGGFAVVYRARHKLVGHQYAVKMMRVKGENACPRKMAVREIRTMARLNHPYIVRYHQAWIDSGLTEICKFGDEEDDKVLDDRDAFYCIQMEYCHRTLKDVLKTDEYAYEEENSMKYFRQLVKAVAYLHERGVVHRDLNPGNIFINSNNDIKLGDFGSATSFKMEELDDNDLEKFNENGISYYKAPEIKQKQRTDEKVDIYSLGIIWFELCFPMKLDSEKDRTLRRLKVGKLDEWLDGLTTKSSLVRVMIAADPLERPPAKEILKLLDREMRPHFNA